MTEQGGPPFTISVQAASYLTAIAEATTRLELATNFTRNLRLQRANRLRAIHSSLAIEGNTLTLDEVTAVVEGKLVAGRHEEIKEVKNAYAAYDAILTFDPYSVDDLLSAHGLLTDGLIAEAGAFRGSDVAVFDGDTPIHVGARPQFVPELVEDLFSWARQSDLHPVVKSAIVHYEIETIHPFADGNGRIGRLWQTLMLAKWNRIFAWIPMERVIFDHRPDYYKSIQAARHENDASAFVDFSLASVARTLDQQVVASARGIEGERSDTDTSTPSADVGVNVGVKERILSMLRDEPRATAASLSEELGKARRTVERHLAELKTAGRLRREGSDKTGRWIVIEENQ